jgi:multidrug transporter EmrE-like cation transporter
MLIYLVLAVLASTLMALGLLMMKSRATSLPEARGARVFGAVVAWMRDPMWSGGMGVQIAGWVFYVIAVSQAPVSMVAVMMQGGIALFVIFSVVVLGERARISEWAGIIAIVVGMILLSISLSAGASQGSINGRTVIELSIALMVAAAASFASPRFARGGMAQAIGSGIAFGLAGLYTKAMTDAFEANSAGLTIGIVTNPWIPAMVVANLTGMVMLQNSFHQARGIITMPLSSALSNLVPIAGGMLAFGERLPADPVAASMRIAAFVLTIAASTTLAASQEEKPVRDAVALGRTHLAS